MAIEHDHNQPPLTYADAGVDIDAGNALVRAIGPLIARTRRSGSDGSIGGFGGVFDIAAAGYTDPLLVAANDGVGTKLRIAIETGQHDAIGIDLVAMCVNDLIVQGAEPLFFLDYFATGRLNNDVAARVIAGIAEGCAQAGCALVGGETAEMPDMYADGDYDLAGFSVGAVERDALLPKSIKDGDILLGLASSGVHSNGYSLVRRVVERSGLAWSDRAPFGSRSLGEELLEPTRIYVKPVLELLRSGHGVRGVAHITGGGLPENLPRVLPDTVDAVVDCGSWTVPPVFHWLKETGGVEPFEMLRTFNCGIGMVLIVAEKDAATISDALATAGETVLPIGRITSGTGTVRLDGSPRWSAS